MTIGTDERPERIWLFQDQGGDVVWCSDPDPEGESRDGEAVEYIRADIASTRTASSGEGV